MKISPVSNSGSKYFVPEWLLGIRHEGGYQSRASFEFLQLQTKGDSVCFSVETKKKKHEKKIIRLLLFLLLLLLLLLFLGGEGEGVNPFLFLCCFRFVLSYRKYPYLSHGKDFSESPPPQPSGNSN